MRCARVQQRLPLYLAGELSPAENDRLSGHLANCAACSALAEGLAATETFVEAGFNQDIEPPVTLDARVMTAIRAMPPPRRQKTPFAWPWSRRARFVLAAVVCGLIAFGIGLQSRLTSTTGWEMANLGQAHSQIVRSVAPLEALNGDALRLAQTLTSRVPFQVRAANLESEGAKLEGGSKLSVQNTTVAALRYRWEGHPISLFEMDGTRQTPFPLKQIGHAPDSYYVHKSGDTVYVAWHSGKTDCVMVAQAVPMHQVFHLACRACERQE